MTDSRSTENAAPGGTCAADCSTLREEVKHVIRDMEEMRAQGILYHREYNWIRGIETRLRNAIADTSNMAITITSIPSAP